MSIPFIHIRKPKVRAILCCVYPADFKVKFPLWALRWTLALYFHLLSGISTCMPQLCAPLNTYQTKHIIPHSLPAPPCSNLLLLWSFCSLISSPSSYCPSRIPGRHPLLHPCSSCPSPVGQQILPTLLYHSSFRTPASGTESGTSWCLCTFWVN